MWNIDNWSSSKWYPEWYENLVCASIELYLTPEVIEESGFKIQDIEWEKYIVLKRNEKIRFEYSDERITRKKDNCSFIDGEVLFDIRRLVIFMKDYYKWLWGVVNLSKINIDNVDISNLSKKDWDSINKCIRHFEEHFSPRLANRGFNVYESPFLEYSDAYKNLRELVKKKPKSN